MQAQNQFFNELVEKGPYVYLLVSADGRLKYVSPNAKDLFGYTSDEILRMRHHSKIPVQDLRNIKKGIHEVVSSPGIIRALNYQVQQKSGFHRWYEAVIVNMLENIHTNAIVIGNREITNRIQQETTFRNAATFLLKSFEL